MVRIRESVRGVECGKHFGKWEVIGPPFSDGNKQWKAVSKCKCGLIKAISCGNLASGHTLGCKSCHFKKHKLKHGETINRGRPTRIYNIWAGMKQRCGNQNHPAFKDYGGRGIFVCEEWSSSYAVFREWALKNGYDDEKQIDRFPNNDGGYEPENCRWVTCERNQRNRRDNRFVEAFGESKCMSEWADDPRCMVVISTLWARLSIGWSPEKAIATPRRQHKTYRKAVSV